MAAGTNWQLTYKQVVGGTESQSSLDAVVTTGQTFNGVTGLTKISQYNVLGGARTAAGVATYQKLVDGKILEYASQSGSPSTLVTRVYDEPMDQAQWRLTSVANTYSYNAPYTEYSVAGTSTRSVDTGTWTYVGQETRAAAAGNFRTCRMKLITPSGTSDFWFLLGKGVMLASRSTNVSGATSSTELVSGTFNGAVLVGDAR